jgi:hypothetical protein
MQTTIFLKTEKNLKGVETSKLYNDTKKRMSNFCESIPLRLENLSVWQIPVFRCGLLMRNRGYIEFEMLEKQC